MQKLALFFAGTVLYFSTSYLKLNTVSSFNLHLTKGMRFILLLQNSAQFYVT